jgi:hypothetical protein
MPETDAQRKEAARKGVATRKAHELEREQEGHEPEEHEQERHRHEQVSAAIDRTSELSDDVLKTIEAGSRTVIEAIRKFVDVVDEALPALPHGERPSRRREIVDAAMDMADRLVKTQYESIRSVVQSAGTSLSRDDKEKEKEK